VQPTLDLTFRALADPTRRDVIRVLQKGPRRASDLADALRASRPAMSRHLRVLRTAGLVATASDEAGDADARERIYSLAPAPFGQLRSWLDEVEQFWSVQLDAFKHHVERTRKR
jgi:DNA-binding transcriptional ArsR family regulator